MQTTNHVLMVRPANFCGNPQTASSNAFQRKMNSHVMPSVAAVKEFDAYVAKLQSAGVTVVIAEDTPYPVKPDACFPNNWFTTHADGKVILYPMAALNRRLERSRDILAQLSSLYQLTEIIDLSPVEDDQAFHEGTGVMVFDHQARTAYVCRSERTSPSVMARVSQQTGYRAHWFEAVDANGTPIYHTNVMMSVGEKLAFICTEAIPDLAQRESMLSVLATERRSVMTLSFAQMAQFCGNVLELHNQHGESILAMSEQAWQGFLPAQRKLIESNSLPVIADLHTIETLGGGGARCMLAEIFLPQKITTIPTGYQQTEGALS